MPDEGAGFAAFVVVLSNHMTRSLGLITALTFGLVLAFGCGDDEPAPKPNTGGGGAGASGGEGGDGATTSDGGMGGTSSDGGMGGAGGEGGMADPVGSCAMPTVIGLGDSATQDTTTGVDDHQGYCQAGTENEGVFAFTATATGLADFTITSDADLVIYARSECDQEATTIDCVDEAFGMGASETLVLPVENGETYYIFVDGFDSGDAGVFTIQVGPSIRIESDCGNGLDDNGNGLVDCEEAGLPGRPDVPDERRQRMQQRGRASARHARQRRHEYGQPLVLR